MTRFLLWWLVWMVLGLIVLAASAVYAVDGYDGGTIPPIIISPPEPFRQVTYCPVHFGGEGEWLWPASH